MLALLFALVFVPCSWAQVNFVNAPLLTAETTFTFTISTTTITKQTPCYVTNSTIPACRRRRGIEERPDFIHRNQADISPSAVILVDATPVPRSIRQRYNSDTIYGSIDDSYYHSMNMFRQLASNRKNHAITVGDCGKSTVNFSQLLSCLGMTVQETTTLTATFTDTATVTQGYTTLTVGGCLPTAFPYTYCPSNSSSILLNSTTSTASTVRPPIGGLSNITSSTLTSFPTTPTISSTPRPKDDQPYEYLDTLFP